MARTDVMTPAHPRWREFYSRLAGPEGCNFLDGPRGITGRCENDRRFASAILRSMGFQHTAVEASLAYFRKHGGFCDCEILMNVDREGVVI